MNVYDYLRQSIAAEYAPERSLRSGGRSTVQVVRHRASGRRFVFREYRGSCAVYRQLLGIRCLNLPQILEAGEREGCAAVLEEYIEGDSLAFLLEGGVLTPAQARKTGRQLCAALWALHSVGAVHRDVKPENVILRGDEAVLVDFDAARIWRPDLPCGADTTILGTTGYAAPEQYGLSQTDPRADLYSLGVLLNVMVTGEHPARTLAPGRLGQIVQRCTMTSPQHRYKDALHLLAAL